MFILLNFPKIVLKKLEDLSELEFVSEQNEKLKSFLISILSEDGDMKQKKDLIAKEYNKLIEEIENNSNIKLLTKGKSDQDIFELIDELILELKEQSDLKRIESLEKKLINNLDENSYSELIKLKSQLNRD